ncbi:hypothetical protein C5167_027681 [Papaver somniferum]|nr:hypothetical protein C5167_027681 [Papaver somniferum]
MQICKGLQGFGYAYIVGIYSFVRTGTSKLISFRCLQVGLILRWNSRTVPGLYLAAGELLDGDIFIVI